MTDSDPIPAILDQLAAHHEQITRLSRTLEDHAAALTELSGITPADTGPDGYHPEPAPEWWKLPAAGRAEPIARLRAWVEQVYRPGYGHLAAALGPCWEAHDLCLYGLDIAAGLWSVLYLQPLRTPGLLSAQAEYQARILPALADQLRVETSWCAHPRGPAQGRPGSRP
ncbi:MAG TPA: hypothetical protein VG123_13280 [Streptosporangiaceae bacterium]|nr:hypothetical protein [Streptosporangiaceae bacterium]